MTAIDLLGPTIAAGGVTTRPTETRSFGAVDTFFRDCSDAVTDDGTEYQAAFFNSLLGNVRALIRGNGQTAVGAVDIVTLDNAADSLFLTAIQQLIQRGLPKAAVDTGTVGHVVAAFTPAVAEHKFGLRLSVQIANTNTGDTDFNPSTVGALPIKRIGGDSLQPGDLRAGGVAELFCMGPGTHYEIVSFIPPSQPGTSTTKAPKLIGFVADQSGAGATSVPSAVATAVAFGHTAKNNLWGTSNFNGTTLTIGAGEAGIWDINAAVHVPIQGASGFEQIGIWKNGVQVFTGTTTTGQAGTGSYVEVSANLVCAAGDTIQILFYHQYGSTISTANDQTTNFSAFLISAY